MLPALGVGGLWFCGVLFVVGVAVALVGPLSPGGVSSLGGDLLTTACAALTAGVVTGGGGLCGGMGALFVGTWGVVVGTGWGMGVV